MGTNCVPLVADIFYTATKGLSWILLNMKIKLLSRLLINIKLRSFESSEHINEKGNVPYRGFGYLSLFDFL